MATVINKPTGFGGTPPSQAIGKQLTNIFKAMAARSREQAIKAAFDQFEQSVKDAPNRQSAQEIKFNPPPGLIKDAKDVVFITQATKQAVDRHHPSKGEFFFDASVSATGGEGVGSFSSIDAARAANQGRKVISASDQARLRSSKRSLRSPTTAEQEIADTVKAEGLKNTAGGRNKARGLIRERKTQAIQRRFFTALGKPENFVFSAEANQFSETTSLIPKLIKQGLPPSVIQRRLLTHFNKNKVSSGKAKGVPGVPGNTTFATVGNTRIVVPDNLADNEVKGFIMKKYGLSDSKAVEVMRKFHTENQK